MSLMGLMKKNPCLLTLLVFSEKEVHGSVSKISVFKIILFFNLLFFFFLVAVLIICVAN